MSFEKLLFGPGDDDCDIVYDEIDDSFVELSDDTFYDDEDCYDESCDNY